MQDQNGKAAHGSPDVASENTAQNSVHFNDHTITQNGHSATTTAGPQSPIDSRAPSPLPTPVQIEPREQWGGKYEFLLSCIGYCVGLGNVWRFPYLCYRNGGGVFLIPYFIMLFVCGVPLFLMELSLGQYGAAGPITVWKCCPLLKGIGIGMLCVSTLVCLYYNVIIAWTFYYLGSSFQSPLPWSCDALANAAICGNNTISNSSSGRALSPSEIFWNERVLGVVNSEGLHDPGPVRWPLGLCLLAAWIIIFLCMLKGIHSSGKVVYVTATFPYFVLIVLIIRGATLEGSLQGVAFYLTPDWSRLANAQVWNDAASQIFYSLGIGVGGLLSMASYNKFDNNVIRDTIIITTGNCCTSFFAGFAIFSILGHMAWRKGVPVAKVADTGPGLAFVAYPEALALLPGSVFWSILFFLMLFMLGVDTLFGNMEGITTAVLDEFPQLRRNTLHKSLFLGTLCFFFYLMGLLLVTDGGIYWFTLIDSFSTSFGLIIITLFMCIGISFFYGVDQFCQDIIDMICHCPPWCSKVLIYFKACWVFFTPFLLLFILTYIFIEMYNTSLTYGTYVYPRWGKALGVCMGATCSLQILIWGTVAICKQTGTLKERFQKSIRPLNTWRPTYTHTHTRRECDREQSTRRPGRSIMNFFLETIQVLLLSIWYNVESFIHLFVPRKRKNIAGEVVLITGAGSGIGRLMAQEFASHGTVVVLWDINQEGMKETAKLAKQSGATKVHYYLCDCSDRNEVYRVADQVKREVGDVSILVNNAGIVTGKKFMDAPDSLIEKTVEVNSMAHFWTYKAFLPAMIANNHGHLVSIASSAGLIGVNGLADYCASKFAAVGFAESIALELLANGKDGIKTTIVCPYFINTGMFDGCQTKWPSLLPILKPDYVAKKIIHAVLTDQVYLMMPKSIYLIASLKNILPMKQGILLGQYLGAFNVMDRFTGRNRKQE